MSSTRVDEIADGIYRISTFASDLKLQFAFVFRAIPVSTFCLYSSTMVDGIPHYQRIRTFDPRFCE